MHTPSFLLTKARRHTFWTTEGECISDLLEHFQLTKWGFVIYRCTYGDDEAWSRFMNAINERIDSVARQQHRMEDLMSRLDWRVQEDPAGLEAATKDEVRRRFRQLVTSSLIPEESGEAEVSPAAKSENPRWNFCIHVDAASLDSVVRQGAGPVMTCTHCPRPNDRVGYVNLIRADRSWDHPDFSVFDWARWDPERRERGAEVDEEDEEEEMYDEREPEIEGCRLADVGWMKVSVNDLLPSLYFPFVDDSRWDYFYLRPPTIMTI